MKALFPRFAPLAAAVTAIALAVFLFPKAASAKFIEYVYDGNGNVTELLDGNTGEIVGSYEYTPFGKTTKIEGAAAEANTIRFSTKYQDQETGLSYYGYRYYDPRNGRWLSRDPIEEEGGWNLYGFVDNQPTDYLDVLGHGKNKGGGSGPFGPGEGPLGPGGPQGPAGPRTPYDNPNLDPKQGQGGRKQGRNSPHEAALKAINKGGSTLNRQFVIKAGIAECQGQLSTKPKDCDFCCHILYYEHTYAFAYGSTYTYGGASLRDGKCPDPFALKPSSDSDRATIQPSYIGGIDPIAEILSKGGKVEDAGTGKVKVNNGTQTIQARVHHRDMGS